MNKKTKDELVGRLLGLLSRKFIFAIVVSVLLVYLATQGMISFDQLMNGLLWALGIFAIANAGQKFIVE